MNDVVESAVVGFPHDIKGQWNLLLMLLCTDSLGDDSRMKNLK